MAAPPATFSNLKAVTLRLHPGDDLKKCLDQFVDTEQIKAACIITCVGSLQQAALRFANNPNTEILAEKFEIVSLTGTLAQAGSHLHLGISNNKGQTIGGHLKEGSLVYTTAEVVLGILQDVVYERETDDTYGFKELVIKQA